MKACSARVSAIPFALFAAAIGLAGLISACSQTVESKPAVLEQVDNGTMSPALSGFFGNNFSLLQPGEKGQAAMRYIAPNVQWAQYTKIMLEPVEFWDNPDSSVSPTDQHMLTAYFYNQLKQDLQKDFTLVDQGGPGVMVIQVALLNASAATPGLRSVSLVVPQLRLLNGLQSLATGSYAFVGSAEAAMKGTDSVTGQLLAAAIDKRAGGTAISAAAQWQWGDAENAMNYWSETITNRLLEAQGRSPAAQETSAQ
ncbi:MAG TPA: DUF3313 domain-containing protein [Candidatus Binataceae bacterium]|nr:DUF3313 domain-containing protein [Candidatus Binataceae bacterium]